MKTDRYFLGIDAGTDSVGYAVTDENYKLLKFKGEPMWGVAVFEAAKQCEERRGYRTARRRLDRRQQRQFLTDEIFAAEILKTDPNFFIKRRESALWREDAAYKETALEGTGYEKKYPTIHHLIVELMNSAEPHDVRLVYWACSWLIAHRGHFLSEVSTDNIEGLFSFDSIYNSFLSLFDEKPWDCGADSFADVMRRKKGVTAKEKDFYELLFGGKKPKADDVFPYSKAAMLRLLCGGKVKAEDLFKNESYSEIKSFSLDTDDDVLAAEVLAELDEDAELIVRLKAMFDWAILVDARKGRDTISEGKVAVYEQHKKDLAGLKAFVHKYMQDRYNEVFRTYKSDLKNYTAYVKNLKSSKIIGDIDKASKASKDDFSDYLRKLVKDIECEGKDGEFLADMRQRLETRTFLPKQVDPDNRIIPHQLYWYELKRVLENAETYLPFLCVNGEDGLSPKDKLLSIFTFRVPYFVGPLNGTGMKNSHAWIVRKAEGKILPWNFEEKVDLDRSEQKFINRMVNRCAYLPDEFVLPKNSLLYSKFTVLNEINNIRVNGEPITAVCKQRILNELFMKKKRVSRKAIEDLLLSDGVMHKGDTLEGIDIAVKSALKSYHDFAKLLKAGSLSEADVERIIERRTYTEDNRRFTKWINSEFPALSEADRKYVAALKYSDFGRLSGKLLNGIEGVRKDDGTGELHTVLHYLWETNDNLMQILSDRYSFGDEIEEQREAYFGKVKNLTDRLDGMYVSNAVKRPIIRTVEIVKEVAKACGHAPEKIFVEMARGASEDQKNKRTESRFEQLKKLYASVEEDVSELSRSLDSMGADADQKLRSESLFLYYMQLGRCMYTGKKIDITKLKDGTYNVDHIYPQCFVKDDSILNNKVLVLSSTNADKGDSYPVPEKFRNDPAVRAHWEMLHRAKLITDEKYHRLTRTKGFTDEEKTNFINRQLVETRQSTKAVASILKEMYPETEIVYVKAGLVSDFRHDFDMLKTRSVNDLHHAKDAYLNVVVGNVYVERFRKGRFSVTEHYNAQPKKLFEKPVRIGQRTVWNGGESIAAVRKTMLKNSIHFTRYAFCRKGGLFDQMPLRARAGLVPRKAGLDTGKYGGYNKTAASFFMLVGFSTGKKKDLMIMPVELMYKDRFLSDEAFALEYSSKTVSSIINKPVSEIRFPLGMRIIKINTVLELDRCRVCITSKFSGGSKIGITLQEPLHVDYPSEVYVKKLEKFSDRKKKAPKLLVDEEFDEISAKQNIELYDKYKEKIIKPPFCKLLDSQISVLEKGREPFTKLPAEDQVEVLLQIVALLKTGRAGGCNLKPIGGVEKSGVLTLSSTLSNWKKKYSSAVIVDVSPAGLFEKRTVNLLDLI
ncbi:MAG: type II CRISPR RNA-guided endonuclease Cas9 [Clostridia bacterium]|nr:type II CRISPR RNA-guided endonuclease Cas9 [Clostridia bacterium]